MKFSAIGIEMAASVIVGGAIGHFLDQWLETSPWMFVFWLLCGVIAGFRSLIQMSKKYLKENKNNHAQRSDSKKEDSQP